VKLENHIALYAQLKEPITMNTRQEINIRTSDMLTAILLNMRLRPQKVRPDLWIALHDALDTDAYCLAVADICAAIHDTIKN